MSQEGHQLRRKNKRVAVGKRQSLESHFLFNYLLDILENMQTRKSQEAKMRLLGDFIVESKSLVAKMM